MRTPRILALVGWAAWLGCATEKPAGPQAKSFDVALTKDAEVAVCAGAGAAAKGMATVTVSADGSSVTAMVTYSGLSGDPTASHIHAGAAGVNGPVVLPFGAPLTSPYSKTFTAADYQANPGAPPDFAAFVTALRAGGAAYINIHTAACKPGELRGEIQ
jgi:hypothetical protein